jgi:hypothetical protein
MATKELITDEPHPHLTLGPRTRREIELRVRELSARLYPTVFDLAELARLEDLLKSADQKGLHRPF